MKPSAVVGQSTPRKKSQSHWIPSRLSVTEQRWSSKPEKVVQLTDRRAELKSLLQLAASFERTDLKKGYVFRLSPANYALLLIHTHTHLESIEIAQNFLPIMVTCNIVRCPFSALQVGGCYEHAIPLQATDSHQVTAEVEATAGVLRLISDIHRRKSGSLSQMCACSKIR